MGKKVKITEEQYKMLQEELRLPVDVESTHGDVHKAMSDAITNAKKYGVNPNEVTFEVPGEKVSESKIISIKDIKENRLKVLRENSNYFPLNDFLKSLK